MTENDPIIKGECPRFSNKCIDLPHPPCRSGLPRRSNFATPVAAMLLYLLTVLAASAHVQASKGGQRSPIDWTPCKSKGKLPVTCANLTVPLDYSDKGPTNTIALSLVKVAANKEPCKGSILFNPGGPGASGTDMINSLSAEIYLL